ncbi:hypothetical protein K458DRAFT_301215 [Lentithecium fluviatile CBS 122367]|uniref:Uncharacterized protein n=1 Tax=Lentithecium fluviatile CBS 122367 TaxID=1168545 RepID=A0A6G1J3G7_9PLEO|nr:hypothetical protein K458DRAFT_301215 [Lentithecium fluviatile CBS 122367]
MIQPALTPAGTYVPTDAGPTSLSLYIQPSTNWEQCAVPRFMAHFVEAASSSTPGYMEFLPQMLEWTFASTRDAFLAVSLANLGNVSGILELQVKSKVHYGQALQSLQAALNDTTTAAADSTLLTIVVLQMYEIIAGTSGPPDADPHETVTTELLRLRSSTHQTSDASKKLSQIVHTRKEVQGMFVCQDENEHGITSSSSPGASFRILLRKVSATCVNLQSTLLQYRCLVALDVAAFTEALQSAIVVYDEVARWPKSTPVEWRAKPHIAPKEVQASGISQIFLFGGIQHGAIWQVYFCTRIHLCQSLLRADDLLSQQCHLEPTALPQMLSQEAIRATIFAAVDDICSCAPYLLGDIDNEGHMNRSKVESKALGAFFLLRGLMVANSVEGLPRRQRRLVLDLLHRVGAQFGIRVAWRLRDAWMAGHRAETELL